MIFRIRFFAISTFGSNAQIMLNMLKATTDRVSPEAREGRD